MSRFDLRILLLAAFATIAQSCDPTSPPPAPSQVAFVAAPTDATAGTPIGNVRVAVRDANGNPLVSWNGTVSLTLTPGTGSVGAELKGLATVNVVDGVAEFTALNVEKAGAGYTLTATASGISATSAPFTVSPGPAARLSVQTQPTNTVAGEFIAPGVAIAISDAYGNALPASNVGVSLGVAGNAASSGVFLDGTTTVESEDGVVTFNGVFITRAGTYTLTAYAPGLTAAATTSFTVSHAAASALTFVTQPTAAAATTTLGAVTTAVVDAFGNRVTSAAPTVTLAIAPGTGDATATLSGATSKVASEGAVTFPDLSVDRAAAGYALIAAADGLTPATSQPFDVAIGAPSKLDFVAQPSDATSAAPFSVAVVVRDAGGNVVPNATNMVSIAITPTSGSPDAELVGTLELAADGGTATFTDLAIARAGQGYTLTATADGLTPATSSAFAITPGAAVSLSFTTQPGSTAPFAAFAPAVAVTLLDAAGNVASNAAPTAVTLSIPVDANPDDASLEGTVTQMTVNGTATFNDVVVDKTTAALRLVASSAGLTGAESESFEIAGDASIALSFETQPANTSSGAAAGTFTVAIKDASGNVIVDAPHDVTVAIVSGTGHPSAILSGTITRAAVNGIATFDDVSIDRPATGYALIATATAVQRATSAAFDVAPVATQLTFVTEPGATAQSRITFPTQPVVQVTDAFGAPVAVEGVTVTATITTGGGTLGGTATAITDASGVATFADLSIGGTVGPRTIKLEAPGLATLSAPIQLGAGAPVSMAAMSVMMQMAQQGGPAPHAPTVRIADADGNGVPGVGVTFTPAAGSAIVGGVATTNSEGLATTQWWMGTTQSTYSVQAAAAGAGDLTFSAIASTPVLINGVVLGDQAGRAGGSRLYTLSVAGSGGVFTVRTRGGTGNANLYVRRDAPPTTDTYDCRSIASGNQEECVIQDAGSGTWYVMLHGATAFSGVDLQPVLFGSFNVFIERAHVIQVTQTTQGSVPLVGGRAALVRVFTRGIASTTATLPEATVVLQLFRNGVPVGTYSTTTQVPSTIDEGLLESSANVMIPASEMTTGLSIRAEIQAGSEPFAARSDNVYPVDGTPMPLDVRPVPALNISFFPIHLTKNESTGDITLDNLESYLHTTRLMMPVNTINASLREELSWDGDALVSLNPLVNLLNAKRLAEQSQDYYHGIFHHPTSIGTVGLADLPGRSAVSWDKPTPAAYSSTFRSMTVAHELGHNFNIHHATGQAAQTSALGFNYLTSALVPAGVNNLMAPATSTLPTWIGHTQFMTALNHRAPAAQVAAHQAAEPVLLVWGRVGPDGRLTLEPAFELEAPRTPTPTPGPYRIEAMDVKGRRVFDFTFAGTPLSHDGGRTFEFALPISGLPRIAEIRLTGGGQLSMQRADAAALAQIGVGTQQPLIARPLARNRSRADWDMSRYRAVMVRDRRTGRILGYSTRGRADFVRGSGDIELLMSNGVASERRAVRLNR